MANPNREIRVKQGAAKADTGQRSEETHLFLLRVWVGKSGPGQRRWHGKVQNVVHGDAHSFTEWSALIDCLLRMLPRLENEQPTIEEGDEQC